MGLEPEIPAVGLLRAYSIIESGFGFTLNLVSDSVKSAFE